MSNNQQKQRRKAQVADIREEGAEAYRQGRHVQSIPQAYIGTMNRYQWEQGYWDAKAEDEAREVDFDEDCDEDFDETDDESRDDDFVDGENEQSLRIASRPA